MENTVEKKTNKIGKVLKIVIDVLLYLIVALSLVFSISILAGNGKGETVVPNLFGNGYIGVKSNSMEGGSKDGGFNKGDLIFVKIANPKNISKLQVDDIVTFIDVIEGKYDLNTHRIITIDHSSGFCITKGDNPTIGDDPNKDEQKVFLSDIKAIYYSPNQGINPVKWNGIGDVLIFMKSFVGFFVVIVLPCLAILVYEGIKLARVIIQNNREKNEQQLALEKEAAIAQAEEDNKILMEQIKEQALREAREQLEREAKEKKDE